jgi:hypothetical protein
MVAQRPLEMGICDLVEDNATMFSIGLWFPVFRR